MDIGQEVFKVKG